MDKTAFAALFQSFKHSAFRLETREVYTVPSEEEEFHLYLAGEPLPPRRNQDWSSLVTAATQAGKTMTRVHALPERLTPYLRFEIEWHYIFNDAAGEDIRLLLPDASKKTLPQEDFWIFDDNVVVVMEYDEQGRLLALNRVEELIKYRTIRDAVLSHSIGLREYLQRLRTDVIRYP